MLTSSVLSLQTRFSQALEQKQAGTGSRGSVDTPKSLSPWAIARGGPQVKLFRHTQMAMLTTTPSGWFICCRATPRAWMKTPQDTTGLLHPHPLDLDDHGSDGCAFHCLSKSTRLSFETTHVPATFSHHFLSGGLSWFEYILTRSLVGRLR